MTSKLKHDTGSIDKSVGGTLFERYFTGRNEASVVAPGTFFMTADYVNLTAFETTHGLVLVDCGMEAAGAKVMEEIRKHSDAPLHTAVFTHGHLDHAFGLKPWLEAGERPRVIAHENVVRRFRTYMKMGPMNAHANMVQFGIVADAERSRQKRYQSTNVYSLGEFGLSEARLSEDLAEVIDRFGFRPESVPTEETREML